MSIDYREFKKLQAEHPWLGVLWRIGDTGYYLGLLGALISPLGAVAVCIRVSVTNGDKFTSLTWLQFILIAFFSFAFCLIICIGSARLKELAFDLGGGLKKYYGRDN